MRAAEGLVARLLRAWLTRARLRGCDELGHGARTHGPPLVRSLGRLEIGEGFVLSSLPVRSHLVTGPRGLLRIGARVHIAHGASISANAELDIGDDVVIGPFAMLLDSDYHDVDHHDSPGEARPIRIGKGARLGAGVVVLRGAVIGEGAVIEAHSVVSRYVPAGVHAAGVPARPVVRP